MGLDTKIDVAVCGIHCIRSCMWYTLHVVVGGIHCILKKPCYNIASKGHEPREGHVSGAQNLRRRTVNLIDSRVRIITYIYKCACVSEFSAAITL